MRTTFRRFVIDSLMSLAALCMLFAILTAINTDLRQQVQRQLTNGQIVTTAVSNTRGLATGVYRTARFQTIGYASLVLFVGAAGVLVLFMLKV
jgi:lipopolysaccharide biosynthesis protein